MYRCKNRYSRPGKIVQEGVCELCMTSITEIPLGNYGFRGTVNNVGCVLCVACVRKYGLDVFTQSCFMCKKQTLVSRAFKRNLKFCLKWACKACVCHKTFTQCQQCGKKILEDENGDFADMCARCETEKHRFYDEYLYMNAESDTNDEEYGGYEDYREAEDFGNSIYNECVYDYNYNLVESAYG